MKCYDHLKTRFGEIAFKKEKNKKVAIETAYADMSRRATGHTSELKKRCVEWLETEVFNTNLDFINSQESFDAWHKETCEELKKRHGSFGKIGRSQKVINMAFKYFSCIDGTYDHLLKYCHMTLDGYTLNWYKTIDPDWKKIEWSKIDDYDNQYFSIQEKIRKYLKENSMYSVDIGGKLTNNIQLPEIPFEAEFIIWEGEIIKIKYNDLIKGLKKYEESLKEKDKWLIGNIMDEFLNQFVK